MNREKRKLICAISLAAVFVLVCILIKILLNVYIEHIDKATKEYIEKSTILMKSSNKEVGPEGLYIAKIKEDVDAYLIDHKAEKIRYEFDGEDFYVELLLAKDDNGEVSIAIDKIVSPHHNVNARVSMIGVESIEYRTGNVNETSLLKINTMFNNEYFAMLDSAYYFLGEGIQSISFKDDQFYYGSYNSKYDSLKSAEACSDEVKKSIKDFKQGDAYYVYGKLNFLKDYYQKLDSKEYTVKMRCEALAENQVIDE